MKKKNAFKVLSATSLLLIASCSQDELGDNTNLPVETTRFIVAASSAEATYLLSSEYIDKGELSIFDKGKEVDNATAWIFWNERYLYRLVYNQGNAGITTAYQLDPQGQIEERNIRHEIQNRFTTNGIYGNHIVTAASGATDKKDASNNPQYGITYTLINVPEQTLSTQTVVSENLLGTGEYCTVSGIIESNGKIYSGVCPEGVSVYGVQNNGHLLSNEAKQLINTEGGISGTVNPNQVWVAIHNSMDLSSPKIITDNRISYATSRFKSQYYPTIAADASGDIYVFSASHASAQSGIQKTSLPSGVLRIKAGTEQFDPNYYVNLEASEVADRAMYKVWHIRNDYFLLQMYAEKGDNKAHTVNTNRLGIFKASEGSFKWVVGLPDPTLINSLSKNAYSDGSRTFIAATAISSGAKPTVYAIDPLTALATPGLIITAEGVSAIGKLTNK